MTTIQFLAEGALRSSVLVVSGALLRLCCGLAMSLRLLRSSRVTGQATEGIEIRESDRVETPATITKPLLITR